MINTSNGNIHIKGKKLVINSELTKDRFVQSDLFVDVLKQDDYGYSRYYIKQQIICEQNFVITMLFGPDDVLFMVTLGLVEDGLYPTWENWSEEDQLQKKIMHDEWLEKNLGSEPYKYSWGSISSIYDSRSASSHITISYE